MESQRLAELGYPHEGDDAMSAQNAEVRPRTAAKKQWPTPIFAAPDDVARANMQGPKKDWRYRKQTE